MLSKAELDQIRKAEIHLGESGHDDRRHIAYYEARQRLVHMGIAVPPQLHQLELVVNMPRVVVDTIEERQDVRNVVATGYPKATDLIRRIMDANNLDSELCLWKRDRLIYGRGFLSVGVGESRSDPPIVRVESPREVSVRIDREHQRVASAVRFSGIDSFGLPTRATLYLPNATILATKNGFGWEESSRNVHNLGVVPIFPSFNRRMTGEWLGHSEMDDIMPITDATVRTLTNLQAAVEVAAIPKRIIAGAKRSDFASLDGFANYLQPFMSLSNENAKAFQLSAADLKNFHETIELYGKMAASVTGFPARYFGLITTNPPAEGAIRAEESKLVKRVERVNAECGTALSQALAFAARIGGQDVPPGLVNIKWHDPATPTFSQKADALQKLAGGKPLISREGAWDELGWTPDRKDQERAYFEAEARDPMYEALSAKVDAYGTDGGE